MPLSDLVALNLSGSGVTRCTDETSYKTDSYDNNIRDQSEFKLGGGGGGENGGSRNFLKELDGGPESFEDKLRGGN